MKLYKVERWNNGTDGWDGNKETLAYFTNIEAASEYSKDEQANFTEIGPVFTTSKEAHIYQDKKKKEWEAKRKAEKRERNKYWMEVITFLLMVISVLYSCLASTIKQVWQWLLMLLKLQ